MDSVTELHRELPFSSFFPLPFRILFLAGVGILGWATNLHGLDASGIDVVTVMELWTPEGHRARSPLPSHLSGKFAPLSKPLVPYAPVYRLSVSYFGWCLLSWLFFRYATQGNIALVDVFGYIPGVSALFVLVVLVSPFDVFQKRQRDMFLHSMKRCLFSSLDGPVYFADVVYADVFTSYAKVLGDVWLSLVMLLPGNSLLVPPAQEGIYRWILPSIMSLPYLTRLRQCLIEYALPTNESRRPLFNALKYATAFPVIYLSAAQRIVVSELISEKGEAVAREVWHGEHPLFRLWLLSVIINSLYSFWWDVTNDWGLDLLTPYSQEQSRASPPRPLVLPLLHAKTLSVTSQSPSTPIEDTPKHIPHDSRGTIRRDYPWGLRSTLLYPLPIYPLVICLNLVLRLTWSIKLSSHLHSHSEGSATIFWLEIAEIFRRWMWVFVRVEWEAVRRGQGRQPRRLIDGDEDEYEMVSSHEGRGLLENL